MRNRVPRRGHPAGSTSVPRHRTLPLARSRSTRSRRSPRLLSRLTLEVPQHWSEVPQLSLSVRDSSSRFYTLARSPPLNVTFSHCGLQPRQIRQLASDCELCEYRVWHHLEPEANQSQGSVEVIDSRGRPAFSGVARGTCSAPQAERGCSERPTHHALARSPSVNVIFLAFGEGAAGASLGHCAGVKGGAMSSTKPAVRSGSEHVRVPTLPDSHGLWRIYAAVGPRPRKRATSVGPLARRCRARRSGLRAADVGALHPP